MSSSFCWLPQQLCSSQHSVWDDWIVCVCVCVWIGVWARTKADDLAPCLFPGRSPPQPGLLNNGSDTCTRTFALDTIARVHSRSLVLDHSIPGPQSVPTAIRAECGGRGRQKDRGVAFKSRSACVCVCVLGTLFGVVWKDSACVVTCFDVVGCRRMLGEHSPSPLPPHCQINKPIRTDKSGFILFKQKHKLTNPDKHPLSASLSLCEVPQASLWEFFISVSVLYFHTVCVCVCLCTHQCCSFLVMIWPLWTRLKVFPCVEKKGEFYHSIFLWQCSLTNKPWSIHLRKCSFVTGLVCCT